MVNIFYGNKKVNMERNHISKAIRAITGRGVSYDTDGKTILKWRTPDVSQPSQADIDAKIVELETEWDALAWSRNRELEYPAVSELTIALYDTDDKAALATKRAAVKTKWPKDNSGPVE
jgi:hypothetical protein